MQDQLNKNTQDIREIKTSIDTIKNNHLFHLERDMEKQSRIIEKMDMRLWAIIMLLVATMVAAVMGDRIL